jgi:hypothetical protein
MGHARAHFGTSWDIAMSHESKPTEGNFAHKLWARRSRASTQNAATRWMTQNIATVPMA